MTDKLDIIFDIDGTLANMDWRRGFVRTKPKNWPAFNAGCRNDTVHEDIAMLYDLLHKAGHRIILASGRGEEMRADTEWWLQNVAGLRGHEKLYMRPAGDSRSDDIVKEELLDEMLRDGYAPTMAFDDRDRVVAMWRRRGLKCLQVEPGNF